MVGKKKNSGITTLDGSNGGSGSRLKFVTSVSPAREESSTPSSVSDQIQTCERLTASLPRFILPEYLVNTQVICQYADSYYYDAKIVKVRQNEEGESLYTIHYNGWHARHDDEITHEEACKKFLVYSPENLAIAKQELAEARKQKNSKNAQKKVEKKHKKEDSDEKKAESITGTTRNQSVNTRQGSSASRIEALSTNEDEYHAVPYLAKIPKEKRNGIIFPQNIDKVLTDDCDLVTRQFKVPKIPGRFTIDAIMNRYLDASHERGIQLDPRIRENIEDLMSFFNKMVNMRILYKFEFVQHLALLNAKRRTVGLTDLPLKDFLEQRDDFNGPDSPLSEETKDEEDTAFKPPKQAKSDVAAEVDSEKRQLRETRNKKPGTAAEMPKIAVKPKKKEKVLKPCNELPEEEKNFNFTDSYGFIHLIRFFYYYNSLIRNKTVSNAIFTNHADLINGIVEFLSLNAKEYFNVEEDYEIATPAYQRQAFSH